MYFDGIIKYLGDVDETLLSPINQILKEYNESDWDNPAFIRRDYNLTYSRLIEFPWFVSNNHDTYSDRDLNLLKLCEPIINMIRERYYPKYIRVRGEIATIVPGTQISYHMDENNFHKLSHRIHVPLLTNSENFNIWKINDEDVEIHLEYGKIYEINNRIIHSAVNRSDTHRTHLIIDLCTIKSFSELLTTGVKLDMVN